MAEPMQFQKTPGWLDWVADLADDGLFGPKGAQGFARSPDWRTEADRILAGVKDREPQN